MRKHFKSKKRIGKGFFVWILVVLISLVINNELIAGISKSFILENNIKNLNKIDIDKDKLLLFLGLNQQTTTEKAQLPVFKEEELPKPKIYLYNTHQTEEYADGTILEASEFLKSTLEEKNIEVIYLKESVPEILKSRNLTFSDSYKITREFMEKNMNDDIALYIDLHRDSSNKKITTATIDEKSYARIMFVVGGNHERYQENYKIADNLNKLFKNFNKNITRGIYVRKSSNYNQDLANNSLLIELGGPYNTMEEIKNTITVITDILEYYVGE